LLDFVTRLQNDPEHQARFAADPVGTMTEAGLSAEDQDVVQSRDPERLSAAVQAQTGSPLPPNTTAW
jgi:hypothetical protein